MMKCSSDNRASTVLQHFLSATATYGLPHKIRTDGGGENDVWRHMIQRRGFPSCVLVGSSVHNTRIERLWSDVRVGYSTDTHHIYCTRRGGNLGS